MILFILSIIMISDTCMPFQITVNNICSSQNNPTPFYYPSGNINVNYRIDSVGIFDRGFPRCKIYLIQGNSEILMYNEIVPKGVYLSTPLNPENIPGLQYNEPVIVKITAVSSYIPVLTVTSYSYFIIYKDGMHGTYGSLNNGVTSINNYSFAVFFSSEDCKSLPSSSYYVRQHKIIYTLNGNFTDSIPVLVNEFSLGYSGALPNNQTRWSYIVSRTDTEIKIATFVYEAVNILGQDMGFVPCRPEQARVVYRFIGTPHINRIESYPSVITPNNSTALLKGNTSGYFDSTLWSDSNNIHNHILIPHYDYAVLNTNLSGFQSDRLENYSVHLQIFNEYFSSNKYKFRVYFGHDPYGCPYIVFNEKGYNLTENHILSGGTNSDNDITDYYLTYNPFNAEKDIIKFSISEKGDDITMIDQLKMFQIVADKNTEAAITDQGEVINFINDPFKNKVLLNSERDVSEELSSIDNNILTLNKDSVLNITVPPLEDNYLIIRGRTMEQKDKISCLITTSLNEESQIYLRELTSDVCKKLDKKNFTSVNISALQDCEIDRIAIVSNLNTFVIKDLNMVPVSKPRNDNIKSVTYDDNIYLTIDKKEDPEFGFQNIKNMENKGLYYFMKITGRCIKAEHEIKDDPELKSKSNLTFKLHENYPNPFNPSTKIRFEIPESGNVRLIVYDITGKLIKTLVNEFRDEGNYEVTFDGSALASGIYFYRLESGNRKEINRMILVK